MDILHQSQGEGEEGCDRHLLSNGLHRELEHGGQATVDECSDIHLGTEEDRPPIRDLSVRCYHTRKRKRIRSTEHQRVSARLASENKGYLTEFTQFLNSNVEHKYTMVFPLGPFIRIPFTTRHSKLRKILERVNYKSQRSPLTDSCN